MSKATKYTDILDFVAYAHSIGPIELLKEMLANGTSVSSAMHALDQIWGDQPEFCPHCLQVIVEEDEHEG